MADAALMVDALRGKGKPQGPPQSHFVQALKQPSKPKDGNVSKGQREIYLIRHGATKLNGTNTNSVDKIRGWSDVPLSEEGREEVHETAEKLKNSGIQAIVSSDLSRAEETSRIIGEAIGVEPTFTEKLRPWDLGELTGQATTKVLPKIAEYVRSKPDEPVPQGESFNSFKARAFDGVREAMEQHPDEMLALVTHHRLERLMKAWAAAGQPPDHNIDLEVFLEKGDPPAGAETIKVNQAALGNGGRSDPEHG